MLKHLALALTIFFALANAACAQTAMFQAERYADFPPATGPGIVHGAPAAFAACLPAVKRMKSIKTVPQLMQECMRSKSYIVGNGFWSCSYPPPTDPLGRTYPDSKQCEAAGNDMLPDRDEYMPMGWPHSEPTVAYDPAAPGPKLLLLAKQVADNGQSDQPVKVANILHLAFTLSTHEERGPASCSASPDQGQYSSDSYVITGDNWFHPLPTGKDLLIDEGPDPFGNPVSGPPAFTYTVTSQRSCSTTGFRDGVSVDIVFDNIPAYACISGDEARAIFSPSPGLMGPTGTAGAPVVDLGYAHEHTVVDFFSVFGFRWSSDTAFMQRESADPHNEPNCLERMEIGSFYPFSAQHVSDFSGKHPMPINIAIAPTAPNGPTPSTTPGDYLLERIKALADNARINDPTTASAILHMPFVLNNHDIGGTVSCTKFPSGRLDVSDDYGTTGDGWFHALPTGKRLLFTTVGNRYVPSDKSYDPSDTNYWDEIGYDVVGKTYVTLGTPSFDYSSGSHMGCTPSPKDRTDFGVTFDNIPPYACISAEQVKAVFGSPTPPRSSVNGDPFQVKFTYSSAYAWVGFSMATTPDGGHLSLASGQPICLKEILLFPSRDNGA